MLGGEPLYILRSPSAVPTVPWDGGCRRGQTTGLIV
jgi:hypothetical protein